MHNKVLIIKNITREGPGLLQDVLNERGIEYDVVDLHLGQEFPDLLNYRALVILGGQDSANDQTEKMMNELEMVKKALDANMPYLGICLGMQVLIKVAGGQVVKSPYKEVGFYDHEGQPFEVIMRTQAGKHDPLFNNMGENFKVFQLHGETVELTDSMQQLAIGRLVKNQVVKVSDRQYGIQCHFELTPEMFEQWISEDDELTILDKDNLRTQFQNMKDEYREIGLQLLNNFVNLI